MIRFKLVSLIAALSIGLVVLAVWIVMRPQHDSTVVSEAEGDSLSKGAREEINRLASLGYLGGYRPPDPETASIAPSPSLMEPGFTLYTSGDAPSAYLLDSAGKVVHSWAASFDRIFPKMAKIIHKNSARTQYWRHATLLGDGSLLIIFDGLGMAKIDRDSHLVWADENHAHHDLIILPNNNLLVLTREIEDRGAGKVFVDYIVTYNANGNEIERISVLDAIVNSPFRDNILGDKQLAGDLLHTNSIQVLDGSRSALPKEVSSGDILISIRERNSLAIINPTSKKVVWAFKDSFRRQHFARVYGHDTIFLFDNSGLGDRSRVLCYNWPEMTLKSEINQLPGNKHFFSESMGLANKLSNGNWLIVDSEGGHIFELTESGKLAFSFTNSHRTGPKNSLMATIPHAERIRLEYVKDWLD